MTLFIDTHPEKIKLAGLVRAKLGVRKIRGKLGAGPRAVKSQYSTHFTEADDRRTLVATQGQFCQEFLRLLLVPTESLDGNKIESSPVPEENKQNSALVAGKI